MVNTPLSPARVEQTIGYLRVFGLVAGIALVLLTDFPTDVRLVIALATIGLLPPVTVVMLWWARRPSWHPGAMVHVGFAADVVLISGFALGFAHLQPNVSWSVVFTLVADGAMRYGPRGSAIGLLLAGPLFVGQIQLHASATGRTVDVVAYVFVLATLVGVAGVLAIFAHVVERQHAAVHAQALELADAQRLRERLIAVSTHELQGSVAAVHLGADTVRQHADRMTPQQIRSTLDVVVRQSAHLKRLVAELLAAARATSDDVSLAPTTADVADSIERALAAAGRHHDQHVVDVSAPHLVVDLDHERLVQVVRNLVENAYKYTPRGGRITLTAECDDTALEVRVADTGPGIPAAERDRVFEPFRRRDGVAVSSEGSGLGLYLVKRIVVSMGGSIDLRSSSSGSEFVVRLPVETPPTSRGTASAARTMRTD